MDYETWLGATLSEAKRRGFHIDYWDPSLRECFELGLEPREALAELIREVFNGV